VVVVADEDRVNQGALVLAAEHATTEALGFIMRHTSGLVSVGMTGDRLDALDLPLMPARYSDGRDMAFTVSVDYRPATTNGVSAADRATTIRALVDDTTEPSDLARPGHVFPLRARPGGVLEQAGHTEAAVDLARLAGLKPAGVLCEIVNCDGTMARRSELSAFAARYGLVTVSTSQLIAYRQRHERLVSCS
jgi:3,4-dihydroxy-2-butanone 4-phosphate synthase